MSTIKSSEEVNHFRSRLFCNGVITVAVAAILAMGSIRPQSSKGRVSQIKIGTHMPREADRCQPSESMPTVHAPNVTEDHL